MEPWLLDEGLKLVRSIQGDLPKYGYHVTLGGSVLNRGKSDKDLDLFFLPMGDRPMPDALVKWLETLWGPSRPVSEKKRSAFGGLHNGASPAQSRLVRLPSGRIVEEPALSAWDAFQQSIAGPANDAPPPNTGASVSTRWSDTFANVPVQTPPASGGILVDTQPAQQRAFGNEPVAVSGSSFVFHHNSESTVADAVSMEDDEDRRRTLALEEALFNDPSAKKAYAKNSAYRYSLIFMRGEDRIDAFIV